MKTKGERILENLATDEMPKDTETRLMSEMLLKRKNASHKELVKGKMRDKGTSTWHVFEEN